MPRKTIAALEAEIAELERQDGKHRLEIEHLADRLAEERSQRAEQARNVFLSYVPSGDSELDALQVAGRAIESLPDPEARQRCAAYLSARFTPEPAGGASRG